MESPSPEGFIMRRLLLCLAFALVLAVPVLAQSDTRPPYKIDFNGEVERRDRNKSGKEGIYLVVRFGIELADKNVGANEGDWQIIIEENNKTAKVVPLPQIRTVTAGLSVIMTIDTSGSMKEHNRMAMAREAAHTFLGNLPTEADCGLVLFDHEVRDRVQPIRNRDQIYQRILATGPRGGTAYRDAALDALKMLANVPPGRDRALVLMTDGADINSTHSIDEVINEAKRLHVRVYTIGIGEPGKQEYVNTALVLDHSGSMALPANSTDLATPKIAALHSAGTGFINMMSKEKGLVSLIPFGSKVDTPHSFSNDKRKLKNHIAELAPEGETALFDAVYTGIAALEAAEVKGKRAVVAMTDGIDNSSRRRVEEVIERAKAADIKLYLLGFGRDNEIDHATMKRMADETDGLYFHATDKDKLLEIFENLSIKLHDDGIDEESLTKIANDTGGQYHPAKEASKLKLVLSEVGKKLQREVREVEFASLNQRDDGSRRNVRLRLVRAGSTDSGSSESVVGNAQYQVHGLIVAEMNPLIYLAFLAVLGGLIALPAALRRPGGSG
jgi:VWFA-related protein